MRFLVWLISILAYFSRCDTAPCFQSTTPCDEYYAHAAAPWPYSDDNGSQVFFALPGPPVGEGVPDPPEIVHRGCRPTEGIPADVSQLGQLTAFFIFSDINWVIPASFARLTNLEIMSFTTAYGCAPSAGVDMNTNAPENMSTLKALTTLFIDRSINGPLFGTRMYAECPVQTSVPIAESRRLLAEDNSLENMEQPINIAHPFRRLLGYRANRRLLAVEGDEPVFNCPINLQQMIFLTNKCQPDPIGTGDGDCAFPPSLAEDFGEMRHFEMKYNKLTGTLPGAHISPDVAGMWPKLTYFSVWNEQGLTGSFPSHYGASFRGFLTYFRLRQTKITGNIPSSFAFCSLLQNIIVNFNPSLTGTIPTEIFVLSTITQMKLNSNDLSGTLPALTNNLEVMKDFWVNTNKLSGAIPDNIENMVELTQMQLHENKFSGAIPTALCSLSKLQIFYANNNKLSGTIPDCFDSLSSMTTFDVSANHLTGPLPATLGSGNTVTAFLAFDNKLYGTIPQEWYTLWTNAETVNVGTNQLIGVLPDQEITDWAIACGTLNFFVGNNSFKDRVPTSWSVAGVAFKYELDGNNLCQDIRNFLGSQATIAGCRVACPYPDKCYTPSASASISPSESCRTMAMKMVEDAYLECNVPGCQVSDGGVSLTDLNYNSLALCGTIPNLALLPVLATVDIARNKLRGTIGDSNFQCSELTYFDCNQNSQLGGKLPYDLFASTTKKLTHFDGGDCAFTGTLPTEFFVNQAKFFSWYRLRNNEMFGTIPEIIGDMKVSWGGLLRFDVLGNTLSGPILGNMDSSWAANELFMGGNNLCLDPNDPVSSSNACDQCSDDCSAYQSVGVCVDPTFSPSSSGSASASISCRTILMEMAYMGWVDCSTPLCSITPRGQKTAVTFVRINQGYCGIIHPRVCEMSSLVQIDWQGSKLTGTIPSCLAKVPTLLQLYLWFNNLSGPLEAGMISGMPQLLEFTEGVNLGFVSTIPTQIALMTSLRIFLSAYDDLYGTIPTEFGFCSEMLQLYFGYAGHDHKFSGAIPSELSTMKKLTEFRIMRNANIVGAIPPNLFSSWQRMILLSLGSCGMTGSIPTEVGYMPYMTYFDFGGEHTGVIPSELGFMYKNLIEFHTDTQYAPNVLSFEGIAVRFDVLKMLKVCSAAQWTGGFPDNFIALPNDNLDLSACGPGVTGFTGSLPPSASLNAWGALLLSNNRFTGMIPGQYTALIGMPYTLQNNNLCRDPVDTPTSDAIITGCFPALPCPYPNLCPVPSISASPSESCRTPHHELAGQGFLDCNWGSCTQTVWGLAQTIMDLSGRGLCGEIHSQHRLGEFPAVTSIDISNNNLADDVNAGWIAVPPDLFKLDFSDNILFFGPILTVQPPSLKRYAMDRNSGHQGTSMEDLDSLCQVPSFKEFSAIAAGLTGEFSGFFVNSNCMQLEYFDVRDNQLAGTLADEIKMWQLLKWFDISNSLDPDANPLGFMNTFQDHDLVSQAVLPKSWGEFAFRRGDQFPSGGVGVTHLGMQNLDLVGTIPWEYYLVSTPTAIDFYYRMGGTNVLCKDPWNPNGSYLAIYQCQDCAPYDHFCDYSVSMTASVFKSPTGSVSLSPSEIASASWSPSARPSVSLSPSEIASVSWSPSARPSVSLSPSEIASTSWSPSARPSVSLSPSEIASVSWSPSARPSVSLSPSEIASTSWSPSARPSVSLSPSEIASVSWSPSARPSVSASVSASLSPILRVHCGHTWVCPQGMVALAGAASVECSGVFCTNDDCCVPTPTCSAAFMCPPTMTLRENVSTVVCVGLQCTAGDCCVANPVCPASFVCGAAEHQTPFLLTTVCASSTCSSTDCCEPNPTCMSHSCSGSSTLVSSPELVTCANAVCTDGECCVASEATCLTYTCGSGLFLAPNAGAITCSDLPLGLCDAGVCCEAAPQCDAFFECPPFYTLVISSSPCSARTCTTGECCVPNNMCEASFDCGSGYHARPDVLTVMCASAVCSRSDCCYADVAGVISGPSVLGTCDAIRLSVGVWMASPSPVSISKWTVNGLPVGKPNSRQVTLSLLLLEFLEVIDTTQDGRTGNQTLSVSVDLIQDAVAVTLTKEIVVMPLPVPNVRLIVPRSTLRVRPTTFSVDIQVSSCNATYTPSRIWRFDPPLVAPPGVNLDYESSELIVPAGILLPNTHYNVSCVVDDWLVVNASHSLYVRQSPLTPRVQPSLSLTVRPNDVVFVDARGSYDPDFMMAPETLYGGSLHTLLYRWDNSSTLSCSPSDTVVYDAVLQFVIDPVCAASVLSRRHQLRLTIWDSTSPSRSVSLTVVVKLLNNITTSPFVTPVNGVVDGFLSALLRVRMKARFYRVLESSSSSSKDDVSVVSGCPVTRTNVTWRLRRRHAGGSMLIQLDESDYASDPMSCYGVVLRPGVLQRFGGGAYVFEGIFRDEALLTLGEEEEGSQGGEGGRRRLLSSPLEGSAGGPDGDDATIIQSPPLVLEPPAEGGFCSAAPASGPDLASFFLICENWQSKDNVVLYYQFHVAHVGEDYKVDDAYSFLHLDDNSVTRRPLTSVSAAQQHEVWLPKGDLLITAYIYRGDDLTSFAPYSFRVAVQSNLTIQAAICDAHALAVKTLEAVKSKSISSYDRAVLALNVTVPYMLNTTWSVGKNIVCPGINMTSDELRDEMLAHYLEVMEDLSNEIIANRDYARLVVDTIRFIVRMKLMLDASVADAHSFRVLYIFDHLSNVIKAHPCYLLDDALKTLEGFIRSGWSSCQVKFESQATYEALINFMLEELSVKESTCLSSSFVYTQKMNYYDDPSHPSIGSFVLSNATLESTMNDAFGISFVTYDRSWLEGCFLSPYIQSDSVSFVVEFDGVGVLPVQSEESVHYNASLADYVSHVVVPVPLGRDMADSLSAAYAMGQCRLPRCHWWDMANHQWMDDGSCILENQDQFIGEEVKNLADDTLAMCRCLQGTRFGLSVVEAPLDVCQVTHTCAIYNCTAVASLRELPSSRTCKAGELSAKTEVVLSTFQRTPVAQCEVACCSVLVCFGSVLCDMDGTAACGSPATPCQCLDSNEGRFCRIVRMNNLGIIVVSVVTGVLILLIAVGLAFCMRQPTPRSWDVVMSDVSKSDSTRISSSLALPQGMMTIQEGTDEGDAEKADDDVNDSNEVEVEGAAGAGEAKVVIKMMSRASAAHLLFAVPLCFFDFATDCLVLVYLALNSAVDDTLSVYFNISLAAIVVPLTLNLLAILRWTQSLDKHAFFIEFLRPNFAGTLFIVGLGTLNLGCMSLLNSRLFDRNVFSAPISHADMIRLRKFNFITYLFENVPQLVTQVLTLRYVNGTASVSQAVTSNPVLVLSICVSLVSVFVGMLRSCLLAVQDRAITEARSSIAEGRPSSDGDIDFMRKSEMRMSIALADLTSTAKFVGCDDDDDDSEGSEDDTDTEDHRDSAISAFWARAKMNRGNKKGSSAHRKSDINDLRGMRLSTIQVQK